MWQHVKYVCLVHVYLAQNVFGIIKHYGTSSLFLCIRYDPNADLPDDTETEQDRVIFIKSVSQFMVGV